MNQCFIVFRENEDRTVMGVFTTLERARAFAATGLPKNVFRECIIEEHPINQPSVRKKYHSVEFPAGNQ